MEHVCLVFMYLTQSNVDITHVEMEDNSLGAAGTRYITDLLRTNSCIQSLV
jgi:hypothetical protein